MGLFKKQSPIDAMFTLPDVPSRECTLMGFPNNHSATMLNVSWLDKQLAAGQGFDYWVTRIFESEKYWGERTSGFRSDALEIVRTIEILEGLEISEEDRAELFSRAYFGILAGIFERSSKSTSAKDCHPLIWNALKCYEHAIAESQSESQFQVEHGIIFGQMCLAGYVVGKIEGMTVGRALLRWD